MYNKLFSKIVRSSIWLEPAPTRIVWLMFIALMDEDGFVQFASVANVAHTARVEETEAHQAITILESPDPNSADPDHEGRRIERAPGGWVILNAEKYRNLVTRDMIRQQTRERVARFRAKQKLECNADVTPSNHQVTQSDTDTEKKKRHASRAPLVDSEWIEDLKTQPAYKNLNVDLLLNRMQNWCAVRKLQPTRRRFINWLNKEDKPLVHTPARPVYGKHRLPP